MPEKPTLLWKLLKHAFYGWLVFREENLFSSQIHQGLVFQHALATPLTAITFSLNQAKQLPNIGSQQWLQQAQTALQYLLELSSAWKAKRRFFLAEPALAKTSTILQSAYPSTLIFRSELPKHLKLYGNPWLFQEAISCVLSNALGAVKPHQGLVCLFAYQESSWCIIKIIDTGSGMSWITRVLARLPGYTRKKHHSGLGLAFAEQVFTQELRGSFLLTSRVGHGTLVTLRLPIISKHVSQTSHCGKNWRKIT